MVTIRTPGGNYIICAKNDEYLQLIKINNQ